MKVKGKHKVATKNTPTFVRSLGRLVWLNKYGGDGFVSVCAHTSYRLRYNQFVANECE